MKLLGVKKSLSSGFALFNAIAIAFSFRLANSVGISFLPLYAQKNLGLKTNYIGVIFSTASLASLFLIFFLSRDFGALYKDKALLALIALGLLLIGSSGGFIEIDKGIYGFKIAVFSLELGTALITPLIITLIAKNPLFLRQRFFKYSASLSFALLIGPLVESLILSATNSNLRLGIFLATLPAYAGLLFCALWALELDKDTSVKTRAKETVGPTSLHFNQNELKGFLKAVFVGLIFEIPFSAIAVFSAVIGHVSDKLSVTIVAIAIGFFYGISFITRLVNSGKKIHIKQSILENITLISSVIGLIGLSFPNEVSYFLSLAILGIAHGICYPLSTSILGTNASKRNLKKLNGYLTLILNASSGIIPLAVGFSIYEIGYRKSILILALPSVFFYVLSKAKFCRIPPG